MPIQYFNDVCTKESRAQQIWPILISCAPNKKLITYLEISKILGFKGAGVFAKILECIALYCKSNDLPPLTILVINSKTGAPGKGFAPFLRKYGSFDACRLAVFKYEWYRIIPPAIEDYKK